MSLPPLPDIFGNYVLGDFNEIAAPPPIDWLPQTPGWYAVAAALLFLFSRYSWRRLRHWYRNRYRREARIRLQALEGSEDIVADVNRLLKLTAMAAFSRQEVARLSGDKWTQFLNSQCQPTPFDDGDCQLLGAGVYQGRSVDSSSGSRLLRASLNWVDQHKNRYDD